MTRTSLNGVLLFCFALVLLALPLPEGGSAGSTGTLTGVHWGASSDLRILKSIGYDFDIRTVNPQYPDTWGPALDAAEAQGLKLIIGGYPEPYSYANGEWTISPAGVQLLEYLSTRSSAILALFVYNEPYWVNPFTRQTDPCGALSADQLRALRAKIRTVWPDAKIYHDIGQPSRWAPGGSLHRSYPCIGDKYADATGVADYVGAWYYPFRTSAYRKAEGLAALDRESDYIPNSMGAMTVWLNQVHACCGDLIWPSDTQILDWNCSTRSRLPTGSLISWYVWRQQTYQDYLANHPEQWPLTTAAACASAPPQAPANSALPTIGGTAQDGQVLTSSTGTWSNSPTGYAHQWQRCDSTGGACTSIAGATATQFTLSSADVGKTLRAVVTATNAVGSSSATSSATAVVQAMPAPTPQAPANVALPSIDGQPVVGSQLLASTGSWKYNPTRFTYQWKRCESQTASCRVIVDAIGSAYVATSADVGQYLVVLVTAWNAAGPSEASSVFAAKLKVRKGPHSQE